MNADERQFLDAIRAEPDADGPRLVYADWLTQQGLARGEQIVIECGDRRDELEARAAAIRPQIPDLAFRLELPEPMDRLVVGEAKLWHRGFIPADEAFCHVEQFAELKDTLYRLAPCAKRLRMYNFGSNPPWDAVLADPDVTRWGEIHSIPTEALAIAAEQSHLDVLRAVTIQANDREDEETKLDPIFARGRFPALETLRVWGMEIDGQPASIPAIEPDRWRTAAFAPTLKHFEGEMLDDLNAFPKLESFSSTYYGQEWLQRIIEFSGSLKSLDIGPYDEEPISMAMLAALFSAPCVKTLDELQLSFESDTSHSSTGWGRLDRMPLRSLVLSNNWLTDDLLRALLDVPLSSLRELKLFRHYRPFSNASLGALVARHAWQLELFDLHKYVIDAALFANILDRMPALRRLRCGAPPEVLEHAALDRLEVLALYCPSRPVLPHRRFEHLHALQLVFPHNDKGFNREHAETWATNRGFRLLPNFDFSLLRSRGDDALTFVRWPIKR